jgi:hypothetical protein
MSRVHFAGHMHPHHYVRGHARAPQHARPIPHRGRGLIRGALLAALIGAGCAAILFIGLAGGFRP